MIDKFSNRLEILLKENKTKKKDLAAAIGLSAAAITEMVKGRSGASTPTIREIARYYHVSEEWLEYGTGEIMEPLPPFAVSKVVQQVTQEENELLQYFRQLSQEQRFNALQVVKGLLLLSQT